GLRPGGRFCRVSARQPSYFLLAQKKVTKENRPVSVRMPLACAIDVAGHGCGRVSRTPRLARRPASHPYVDDTGKAHLQWPKIKTSNQDLSTLTFRHRKRAKRGKRHRVERHGCRERRGAQTDQREERP